MAICVQLDGAYALDKSIWKASLSPKEVGMFGTAAPTSGVISVLLLNGVPKYDPASSRLTFDPATAKLLVAGSSNETILIASGAREADAVIATEPEAAASGDASFLSSLPRSLDELGRALLEVVRSKSVGDLRFYPKSGRYVESPDNFWTVKPQPRDVSFRITVRGVPESFQGVAALELKPDQSGYSSFKLSNVKQLAAFARLVDQIQKK